MRISNLRLQVASTLLLLAGSAVAQEPFQDLEVPAALARAEKADRVVVLFFHNPELTESRRMLTSTYGDESVRAWLAKNAVAVKFEESNEAAIRRFAVSTFPLTLVLRPDARVLYRVKGYMDPTDFLVGGETALIGLGEAKRPEGEQATNPIAWLAWANWLFANAPDRSEECTEAYLYCLDHGDDTSPGFRARHLEFMLERLSYLKAKTEKAINAYFVRRDDMRARIAAGIGTPTLAYEYTRFNYWLRDEYLTVEFFVELGLYDTPEHDVCRRVILQAELKRIVDHRHYDMVLELIPDPRGFIEERLREYTKMVEAGNSDTGVRAAIIDDASSLYECLLHAGKGSDAMALLDRVTSAVPTGRAFYAFLERANRLELYSLSRTIVAKGLEQVKGEKGRRMLENAAKRIPKTDEVGRGTAPIPTKGGGKGDGGR